MEKPGTEPRLTWLPSAKDQVVYVWVCGVPRHPKANFHARFKNQSWPSCSGTGIFSLDSSPGTFRAAPIKLWSFAMSHDYSSPAASPLRFRLDWRTIWSPVTDLMGLPQWLSAKESTCQCRRHRFNPWVGKIPWRRKWQPTPWTEESHGQKSPVGYSPWGCKELDMTEQLSNNNGPHDQNRTVTRASASKNKKTDLT